jgi:dihydroxyacetone kinase
MTLIFNDPENFVDESLAGFIAANADIVAGVNGGVVRSSGTPSGQVAVVIGGGSGHYPAFGGLVGQGLAHGAAIGNVFASPSSQQIYEVAKAAENGGGVLFTYGNYAGDVLNFDEAQRRLRAEGIACETVVVTDDIASADKAEVHKRRGIAGDLIVFKAAAYASEAGMPLDDVFRIASLANDNTFTLGVAFSGCTLPGSAKPLFEVSPGIMEIGMGIHGEPGLRKSNILSAKELAKMLVSEILADTDSKIKDATVLLSGLGTVKYEELFLLYKFISQELTEAGLNIHQPEVGELVTSFDMAGISLTISYLEPDLTKAWSAPCYAAGFKKGTVELAQKTSVNNSSVESKAIPKASEVSQQQALELVEVLAEIDLLMQQKSDYLGSIDAVAGDGDHGIGMRRGSKAALSAAKESSESGAGLRSTLISAAESWSLKSGGTSGALWGMLLKAIAEQFSDEKPFTPNQLSAGLIEGLQSVKQFGKAELGDKTLVDALEPLVNSFSVSIQQGKELIDAWSEASEIAMSEAEKTEQMIPKIGRARPHAEASVGTPDPGAISLSLIAMKISMHMGAK